MRRRPLVLSPLMLSRRDALKGLSTVLAAGPLASVIGCADENVATGMGTSTGSTSSTGTSTGNGAGTTGSGGLTGSTTTGGTAGTNGSPATTTGAPSTSGDGGMVADASAANDGGPVGSDAGNVDAGADASADTGPAPADGWASGGTASMTGIDSYPDPFAGSSPTACALFASMTVGPCYDPRGPEREDISEGKPGLPMRLALRILDENCQPITDANVDIWQTHALGLYSGDPESPLGAAFCTGGGDEAASSLWFRGHQPTDANGVAWFNACFPGWYSGHAIHTHFTVRRSDRQGDEYLTSQLAYPDDLTQELCTSHPDYEANGSPDTTNTSDGIFPGDYSPFVLQTQRMADGALLAWKTIIIGSSPASGGGGLFGV